MFEGTRCSIFQKINGLKPNTTYKVSVFIKSENNEAALLKVRFYGDKDITRRYSKSQYGEVTATFKTGPDNTSARIALLKYAEGATGKTWFDDLSVTEVGAVSRPQNNKERVTVKLSSKNLFNLVLFLYYVRGACDRNKKNFKVDLKYYEGIPVIKEIKRVSKLLHKTIVKSLEKLAS